MINTKICCDNCGTQLNIDSSYPANYGLALRCVNYGINTSGSVYCVQIEPKLKREMHFCGFGCIRAWLTKNYPGLPTS
jgi:hypothetical protein